MRFGIKTSFLFAGLIFFDQIVKYLIRHWDGFYICNYGVAFGLRIFGSWLMILSAMVILLAFYLIMRQKEEYYKSKELKIGLVFFIAGAISNIIDRLLAGCVIDFIDIKLFNFPLFNPADIFITIGAMLVAWSFLILKK